MRSVDYPLNYPSFLTCEWLLLTPLQTRVRLHFLDFQLESSALSGCVDYIEISRSIDGTTQPFCGNSLNNVTIDITPNSTVSFVSDGNDESGRGFSVLYSTFLGNNVC